MNSTASPDKALLAFLNIMAQFRHEEADAIYDTIASGYDRFADHWDRTFARPALDALFQRLAEQLPADAKVLDAGCGTGRQINEYRQHINPAELVGIDKSVRMLDYARRRFRPAEVPFVQGDIRALPFPDDTFDAVMAIWVLETLSDPQIAVREFLRVVKPEGIVCYTFVQIPAEPNAARSTWAQAAPHLPVALAPAHMPFHHCDRSTLERFRNGLISVVTLGKCCSVDSRLLPTFDQDSSPHVHSTSGKQPFSQ